MEFSLVLVYPTSNYGAAILAEARRYTMLYMYLDNEELCYVNEPHCYNVTLLMRAVFVFK
jgi:hypothetical protein